jgi:hypothetical protein
VDVDMHLIMDASTNGIRTSVLEHLDTLAAYTGADIFLLSPKGLDGDSAVASSYEYENGLDNRFRVAIYGDMESAEHAKTRLLIMIDQIVYDSLFLATLLYPNQPNPTQCHRIYDPLTLLRS